jgi:HEAT repeat protein
MRTRYLVLDPLGELARGGDHAAAARLGEFIARDADWPVRGHAAELGVGLPETQAALVAAARDPEPRVREAALQSLAQSEAPGAADAAVAVLGSDGWPFVKSQAVRVLARAPSAPRVDDALGRAIRDPSQRVRAAVLLALGQRRASSWHGAVRERLDDKEEDAEVRAGAAQALGAMCDAGAVDRLTELARLLGMPGTTEDQQQIAVGALVGLAALQPADLRRRLLPLLAPSTSRSVRSAAEQALSARSACR